MFCLARRGHFRDYQKDFSIKNYLMMNSRSSHHRLVNTKNRYEVLSEDPVKKQSEDGEEDARILKHNDI